jgi:hypothetical protein
VRISRPAPGCPRGHHVERPCSDGGATGSGATGTGSDDKVDVPSCEARCGARLACGHGCPADCGACSAAGDTHAACSYLCARLLVCGHACDRQHACDAPCPPCERPCETRCKHSECDRVCGAPCAPCNEPCKARCEHSACSERCSNICKRERCDKPCRLDIPKCGHPCIGLCGEPCPELCRLCHASYQDTITLLELGEAEPSERFLQLADCGHLFAVHALDRWMDELQATSSSGGKIKMPACPGCRAPIRRSLRYADIVRRCSLEVEQAKMRSWLGPELRHDVLAELQRSESRCGGTHTDEYARALHKQIRALKERVARHPRAATLHLVLAELALRRANNDKPDARTAARQEAIQHLETCLRLVAVDEAGEPRSDAEPTCDPALTLRQRALTAHLALLHWGLALAHVEAQAEAARRRLEGSRLAAQRAGIAGTAALIDIDTALADVAQTELKLQEAAVDGVERGSWHRCPNGHLYVIGECGGAVSKGTCPDCGETVGGANHTLAPGNTSEAPTPWDRVVNPDPDLVARLQRE